MMGDSLRASVQMADEHIPRWLQVSFGGLIYHRQFRQKRWKPQVQWIITGEQAGGFMKAIRPYLILKRTQAEIALKFLGIKGKGQRANPFERYLQESHRKEIMELNKRGVEDGRENTGDVPTVRDDAVSGEPGKDG